MISSIYFGNKSVKHSVTLDVSTCYEGRGSGR